MLPFVYWLEGCIAGYLVSSAASDYDSHAGHIQAVDITKEIQTRLGNIFAHEISYGKDKQDAMNQAHSGSRPPRRPGLIHDSDRRLRC